MSHQPEHGKTMKKHTHPPPIITQYNLPLLHPTQLFDENEI